MDEKTVETLAVTAPITPARRQAQQKYIDNLVNGAIERLGKRKDLEPALLRAGHAGNDKAAAFLALLADPKMRGKSLSRIAQMAGMSVIELHTLMRDYHASEAMLAVYSEAPNVVRDVIADAKTVRVECPRCGGFGKVWNDTLKKPKLVQCPRCKGKKTEAKAGNSAARQLVGEIMGWTKNGGPAVNINLPGVGVSPMQALEEEAKGMDGKVIDL